MDTITASPTCYGSTTTPIGRILLVGSREKLVGLSIDEHDHASALPADAVADDGALDGARAQLDEYFAGVRAAFDLAVDPVGTDFQRAVWSALAAIPYGETTSYGAVARRIGRPRAGRAVGAAVGANPVPIVVPCHRVIGADGRLTGYGWGVERKEWLLRHEQR